MKNNEIITMAPMNITNPTFQDDRLNKATQRIAAIYNDAAKYADTKNREIAKILADVSDKKSYEADGFKSVADYANMVFGIARQNAYALANAGKVYNDKNAHKELQAMSPSKLAEISSLDSKVVTAALDSGEITHETTQKDLREFAAKAKTDKESEKTVVVETYTARPCLPSLTDEQKETFSMNKTIEEWDDWFMNHVHDASPYYTPEVINLPKGRANIDSKKATVIRRLYLSRGFSIVVEFFKYKAPKTKVTQPDPTKYTKEQLLAMLTEMEQSDKTVTEESDNSNN